MDAGEIGTVTSPGRYRLLHDVADRLLDDLERQYRVARTEGLDVDRDLCATVAADRVVRLAPTDGAGAPITIAFTSFPGLFVRFGRWYAEPFPQCGCDYCDEPVERLTTEFLDKSAAVVSGRFTETSSGDDRPRGSFQAPEWSGSASGWLDAGKAAGSIDLPPEGGWRPWPRR